MVILDMIPNNESKMPENKVRNVNKFRFLEQKRGKFTLNPVTESPSPGGHFGLTHKPCVLFSQSEGTKFAVLTTVLIELSSYINSINFVC